PRRRAVAGPRRALVTPNPRARHVHVTSIDHPVPLASSRGGAPMSPSDSVVAPRRRRRRAWALGLGGLSLAAAAAAFVGVRWVSADDRPPPPASAPRDVPRFEEG